MKIQDIPKLTDAELDSYLASGGYHEQGYQFALQEHNRRKLKALSKPHWTRGAGFWVAVIAAIAAIIAALPVVREWIPKSLPVPVVRQSSPEDVPQKAR